MILLTLQEYPARFETPINFRPLQTGGDAVTHEVPTPGEHHPGYYDDFYTVNEETGEITFHPDNEMYAIERDAFRAHGLDLEKVKTFDEYVRLSMITKYTSQAIFEERTRNRIMKKKNPTLRERALLANINGDFEEGLRLLDLAMKKHALGLKVVS